MTQRHRRASLPRIAVLAIDFLLSRKLRMAEGLSIHLGRYLKLARRQLHVEKLTSAIKPT